MNDRTHLDSKPTQSENNNNGLLLKIGTGFIGLLTGGCAGILITIILSVLGLILIAAVAFLALFDPLYFDDRMMPIFRFSKNIAPIMFLILTSATAVTGAIIGS